MQKITAPEILWRIFTLVESNADLARASRLNKFIGAAALDVLWNDIYFNSFLSLFPTENNTRVDSSTNIQTPLSPKHWKKVNPYACRVKTLRRSSEANSMEQILTCLKLNDRGSEMPFMFPKLQSLIWSYVPDLKELPLIANLFLAPTLKEISIRRTEGPPDQEQIASLTPLLLAPLHILSESDFSTLRRLHLPLPLASEESLNSYHITVTDLLLHLTKWQLEEVSIILTRDILHILATFESIYSLELHDLPISPPDLRSWGLVESDATGFKKLQSLSIRNLRSLTSVTYLEYSQCVPSHRMELSFFPHPGEHLDQDNPTFSRIIRLLSSRKMSLETLDVDGVIDLMEFLEPLLEFPSLKELFLGPDVVFDIQDDTVQLISTKWTNLTHLSIYENQGPLVSLNGIVSLLHCPIQTLRLSFTLSQQDISNLRQRIENSEISPIYSLRYFYLTDLIDASDNDVTGAAFVLTYLFPCAQFVPQFPTSRPGAPADGEIPAAIFLQKVLQIRKVNLELLGTLDIFRLTEINQLLKSINRLSVH